MIKNYSECRLEISNLPPTLGMVVSRSHLKNNDLPIIFAHAKSRRHKVLLVLSLLPLQPDVDIVNMSCTFVLEGASY
jgi:hypothetical protein